MQDKRMVQVEPAMSVRVTGSPAVALRGAEELTSQKDINVFVNGTRRKRVQMCDGSDGDHV